MPNHIFQRTATGDEQAFLKKMLENAPTTSRRWKQGIENAFVLWAASLLGVIVLWLGFAWLMQRLHGVDWGLHSSAGLWVIGIAVPVCAVYAVASSVKWIKGWKDYRSELREDIAQQQVVDEHYVFSEAKRFQEQEHGGLMYFLHTSEGKVLTIYDHESQDLGIQGDDPLKSSFRPKSELHIVRSPKTGFVINSNFSGEILDAGDPIDIGADPEEWPESETYCNIPWAELERKLGNTPAL